MATKNLEQLIEQTQSKFIDSHTVAFLGKVESGKTIVSALLKHTLTKHWIPNSNGKWEAVVTSGYKEVNEIIRGLKEGNFPASTPENNYPKMIIDIHNMNGKPVKLQLKLHDMSGENYSELLTDLKYSNTNERLKDILKSNATYLAYARKYVIMIDCSQYDNWDTDIAEVAPMLSTLREIKQKIHRQSSDEKIHTPIAIIFSKADLLKPEIQEKSAEELAEDYPALLSSLKINHDGSSLSFFKLGIDSEYESNEDARIRVENKEKKMKDKFEEKMRYIRSQRDDAMKTAALTAENQAVSESRNSDEVMSLSNQAREHVREQYREELDQTAPEIRGREKALKPKSVILVPLEYNEAEYSRLISWIVD